MNPIQRLILIAVVCLLATSVLRFHDLSGMVVWHDEVHSLARISGVTSAQMGETLYDGEIHSPSDLLRLQAPQGEVSFGRAMGALKEHPEHGPLYYLLGWALADWTERPITALRGASALFSLLLFPAVFWLARELGGRRFAWSAMALAAASPLFFLYAREARQYALWLVLITAASAMFIRLLRYNRSKEYLIYSGLLMLALYTQLMTGLIILAHALLLALMHYRQREVAPGIAKRLLLAWGAVLLAFTPWLGVIYEQRDNFKRFTGWMSHSVSLAEKVEAWLGHIARLFVDLPGAETFWVAGGMLMLLVGVFYFRQAPLLQRRFVALMILIHLAVVILPDLLLGGRRSLETRYLLPMLLMLQFMIAWALACGFTRKEWRYRAASQLLLIVVLGMGLLSQYVISQADSWWTKSLSRENAAFARLVNASPHPLILGSSADTSSGEILSLAHRLDGHVRLLLEDPTRPLEIPSGYTRLFALLPSDRLRTELEKHYILQLYPGSWKWFVLTPRR